VEGVFSSGEEAEGEAFGLAIGLGLAARVLMTILIYSSVSLGPELDDGKNKYVLVNTCSKDLCFWIHGTNFV